MRACAALYRFGGQDHELQIRVFACYVSQHGHAFIDRALYLPKASTDDPARMKAAHVPEKTAFATKPALVVAMIEPAIAAAAPFASVAADSIYGVGVVEKALRRAGKGYVLGVAKSHSVNSWGKAKLIAGAAESVAQGDPERSLGTLSGFGLETLIGGRSEAPL